MYDNARRKRSPGKVLWEGEGAYLECIGSCVRRDEFEEENEDRVEHDKQVCTQNYMRGGGGEDDR